MSDLIDVWTPEGKKQMEYQDFYGEPRPKERFEKIIDKLLQKGVINTTEATELKS